MKTVLGIDLGTQSLKVLFYDFANREVVACESSSLELYQSDDGTAEQQARWWLNALEKVLAKVGDGIGEVRGRRFLFDSDALDKLISSACYSSKKIQRDLGFRPTWDLRSALPEIVTSLGMKRADD